MSILNSNKARLIAIIAIGLISMAITISRLPINSSSAGGQKIEVSSYGVSVYNSSGSPLFTLTPLNDYFYEGQAREHLENTLVKSTSGNLFSESLVDFENLIFGKQEVIWDTQGSNSKGKSVVKYTLENVRGGLKVTRQVSLENVSPTSIGQVLTICSDCIVTDNNNRAYFNGDTVNSDLINISLKFNKVPTIIGENQSIPQGVSRITIIGRDGQVKMSIPVDKETVYLQDKWHLLEFKTSVKEAKTETVSQIINF